MTLESCLKKTFQFDLKIIYIQNLSILNDDLLQ